MHINWYPGHMKKTKELIQNHLKIIDVVIELLDARIPISSRNPNINEIIGSKPKVIVLNKADLSDPIILKEWIKYFKENDSIATSFNSIANTNTKELIDSINLAGKRVIDNLKQKGITQRPLRIMIVGIPNVGKSSLINRLAGKKTAKTGNKPGVTKGKQWIRINKQLELFDTPGILWPKIEDERVGLNLAFTGAIKDEILNIEDISVKLLEILIAKYPDLISKRYNINDLGNPLAVLENIALKRGCIKSGGELDYFKASNIVLEEFRKGVIGRITLEEPKDLLE